MSDKPNNPSAFPQSVSPSGPFGGMTLRDWFAGQALATCHPDSPQKLAWWAYQIADAMLAERERGQ